MNIIQPNLISFNKNYNLGKNQIIFASLAADVHTPVSTLIKFKKEKYSFLFESVEKGSQKGRFSIIGLKPDLIWQCKDNLCTINDLKKN